MIDTPGLKSFYEDDSKNTQDFLQLYGDALTEITQAQAAITNYHQALKINSPTLTTKIKVNHNHQINRILRL
ncbi:MAG: hypothetical protein AB4426_08650 [Xenococcaceae cyanobacterium]